MPGSIGSVGDAYDNAMAESFVDSFKTELIADRVWRTRTQLERAIVECVSWFNHQRLHQALGDRPPAEAEALYAPAISFPFPLSINEKENPPNCPPRNPARLTPRCGAVLGSWRHLTPPERPLYATPSCEHHWRVHVESLDGRPQEFWRRFMAG